MRPRHLFVACALCLPALAGAIVAACGGGEPVPMSPSGPAPAGNGYDDLRELTHEACVALADHQIEIAVSDALSIDGGSTELEDAGERLRLQSELRIRSKERMDAFVAHCTGSTVTGEVWRCLRNSTTTRGYNACDREEDAGAP